MQPGVPDRQPYAGVDFIPQSGTSKLASAQRHNKVQKMRKNDQNKSSRIDILSQPASVFANKNPELPVPKTAQLRGEVGCKRTYKIPYTTNNETVGYAMHFYFYAKLYGQTL
jgi:hypothetical protein